MRGIGFTLLAWLAWRASIEQGDKEKSARAGTVASALFWLALFCTAVGI